MIASGCSAVPVEIDCRSAARLRFFAVRLEPMDSLSASRTAGSVSTYRGTTSRSRSAGSTKRWSTLRTVS